MIVLDTNTDALNAIHSKPLLVEFLYKWTISDPLSSQKPQLSLTSPATPATIAPISSLIPLVKSASAVSLCNILHDYSPHSNKNTSSTTTTAFQNYISVETMCEALLTPTNVHPRLSILVAEPLKSLVRFMSQRHTEDRAAGALFDEIKWKETVVKIWRYIRGLLLKV
jgi:hypothetical protein